MMISRAQARLILPLLVLLLAGGIYQALMASKTERRQPELIEKIWRIDVIEARRQRLSPSVTLYGRIESPEQLQAAAPGGGVVAKVFVRDGDPVLEGQQLVTLDRRDFEAALLQAQADLRDLDNQISELEIRYQSDRQALQTERELLAFAAAEVERLDKLQQQNLSADTALNSARSELGRQRLSVMTRQLDVDSYPARRQILLARRDRARAELGRAQLAMQRSEILAPFDAIVSEVAIAAGDRVSLGQILISLFPIDSLEIRAHLPLNHLDAVQQALGRGQALEARLARRGDSRSFALLRLAGAAEATGIDAYFAVEPGMQMRPGELLPLELYLPPVDDVIPLPYQAIYGNSRIYRVVEERLQALDVTSIGQTRSADGQTLVLIRSGAIEAGDRIAITHLPNAVSGLKVETDEY